MFWVWATIVNSNRQRNSHFPPPPFRYPSLTAPSRLMEVRWKSSKSQNKHTHSDATGRFILGDPRRQETRQALVSCVAHFSHGQLLVSIHRPQWRHLVDTMTSLCRQLIVLCYIVELIGTGQVNVQFQIQVLKVFTKRCLPKNSRELVQHTSSSRL